MLKYLQLTAESALPDIRNLKPFKTIVVIETSITPQRQAAISKWLIASGCLYIMAWGQQCSSWNNSVDSLNIDSLGDGETPDTNFVLTTWHASESLEEVFWFAKYAAVYVGVELPNTLILHLGDTDKGEQYTEMYKMIDRGGEFTSRRVR